MTGLLYTGGLRSGVVVINPGSSEDAYAALCYEAGIHRVQRVPKTERTGRMHTSTVAVVVMLQPTEVSLPGRVEVMEVSSMKGIFNLSSFIYPPIYD